MAFSKRDRTKKDLFQCLQYCGKEFFASCLFTSTITHTLHFILKDKLKSRQACIKMYRIFYSSSLLPNHKPVYINII